MGRLSAPRCDGGSCGGAEPSAGLPSESTARAASPPLPTQRWGKALPVGMALAWFSVALP